MSLRHCHMFLCHFRLTTPPLPHTPFLPHQNFDDLPLAGWSVWIIFSFFSKFQTWDKDRPLIICRTSDRVTRLKESLKFRSAASPVLHANTRQRRFMQAKNKHILAANDDNVDTTEDLESMRNQRTNLEYTSKTWKEGWSKKRSKWQWNKLKDRNIKTMTWV